MARVLYFSYSLIVYVMFLGVFLYAVGFVGGFAVPKTVDSGTELGIVPALLIDGLLLGLFAVQHSVMARPGFKRWWTKFIPAAVERTTYVLATNVVLIVLFTQWVPIKAVVWDFQSPLLVWAAWAVFGLGWLMVLSSTFLINHFDLFGLRQTWLPMQGKAVTPLGFTVRGLYKLCRHPLMLGFMLAFIATPHMTAGHLFFAVMSTGYILIALIFEEKDLINALGQDYLDYKQRTPKLCPFACRKPKAGAEQEAVG